MPYIDSGGRQRLNSPRDAGRSSRRRSSPHSQGRGNSNGSSRLRTSDGHRSRNGYSSLRSHNIRFGRNSSMNRLFGGNLQGVLLIVAAIAILVVIILGISSCVHGCSSKQETPEVNENDSRVAAGVSADLTQQFTTALDRDEQLSWIAANADKYSDTAMLELALNEPAAIDFVASYPASDKTAELYGDSVTAGSAPQLYDWDKRWGNVDYAGSALGVTGSGPTALSMAYMGITGSTDKTAADIAGLVTSNGLATGDSYMDGGFLENHAADLNLTCKTYEPSADNLLTVLDAGTYIMIEAKAGTLTSETHWVLLVTENSDTSVVVYDPTSTEVSSVSWTASKLASSCSTLYSLTSATKDDGSSSSTTKSSK